MRLARTTLLTALIPGLLLFFGVVSSHAQTGLTYYYVSPTGDDSNPGTESLPWKTLAKAASVATAGVTVFIKQGIYNERLVPLKSGTSDAPITFTSYPGDSVTIDGNGMKDPTLLPGLVFLDGMNHIKISGLRVLHSETCGIQVKNSSFVAIGNNYIDSTYDMGIKVHACDNILVESNEVVRGCLRNDLEECLSVSTTSFIEIKNNRVHDGRTIGIDVKYGSSNAIVSKNEVYNQIGNIGIYVEAWTLHEFNIDVFDNFSHDNQIGFAVTSEMGGLIEDVRVHHNTASRNQQRGIMVGGWGGGQTHPVKNLKVYGNTVYENGFGIEIGGYTGATLDSVGIFNNLVYHNTSAGVRISQYDGPSGDFAMSNISIVNNTIYGNGKVGSGWDADNSGMNIFNVRPQNLLIRNNIISSNAYYTIFVGPEVPTGSVTIDFNLLNGFRNATDETAGTNAVYGIPSFVDSLRNDYHLQATSPCIDKGSPNQAYNDPADPNKPGYALYPAQGTLRNDLGAYGGPYATSWDLATSLAKPQTPALNSPADSARGVSTRPMLSWNGILGADRYRVQLSNGPTFGSKLVDDSMVTDSYRQVGPLQINTTYYWRVSATNVAGTSSYSTVRTFTTAVASAVDQLDGAIPTEYALRQNYPNPFNPTTTIQFALPKSSYVILKVFDALAREVTTLVSHELSPGYFTIRWNANVPSGIYFYRLQARQTDGGQAGQFVETKKMILLK